ncbi:MAG: ATP-dependent Clp protease adaptor ClpS [Nitrospinaceae bacterium]|jgi:ATP-dependent Clp protease adaptor protein ClpS|nr:MAG: ATP-dependent Clp protease adaptor ClpS [Nitrospinaceae bacterium]
MATETLPFIETEEAADQDTTRSYLPMYKVIMWNDDVTTMEFVVRVLVKLFGKDYNTAERLMYEIHASGAAHVATLPLEQAEFKVEQVHAAASLEQFPFTCTIEPA